MADGNDIPQRTAGRKALYWLILLGVTLLLQEVVLRICFPMPEVLNFNRIQYQELAVMDEQAGYLRNTSMVWKSLPDTTVPFEHQLNNYGFRDRDWEVEKPAGKQRILFLGDSFLEGCMAGQDEKLTDTFAAEKGEDQFDILNAGMIGIGIDHYCYFVQDAVPLFKPDVVYLVIYANDMIPETKFQPGKALEPEFSSFWTPRLVALIGQLKAANPLPTRWRGEARAFMQPVPAVNNPWTKNEEQLKPHVRPDLAVAMKRGDFNFFRINIAIREEARLQLEAPVEQRLEWMADYCKQNGAELRVAYIPSRAQVTNHYYQYEKALCQLMCPPEMDLTGPQYQLHAKQLSTACSDLSVPFLDLTEPIRREEARGNRLFWDYDEHMRANGYELLGREIAKAY